jgi:hypothetical protein
LKNDCLKCNSYFSDFFLKRYLTPILDIFGFDKYETILDSPWIIEVELKLRTYSEKLMKLVKDNRISSVRKEYYLFFIALQNVKQILY